MPQHQIILTIDFDGLLTTICEYLSIDEELPIELLFSRAWVPSEKDTGTRGISHVTEHHTLDIHSCALQACYLIDVPVLDSPWTVP